MPEVGNSPSLVAATIHGPCNQVCAGVFASSLNVNGEVVSLKTDGAVLVELPLLVSSTVALVLNDLVSLFDSSLNIEDLARVLGDDVTIVVELELLVGTTVVVPDDQGGSISLGSSLNVQNLVVVVLRDNVKVISHGVCC